MRYLKRLLLFTTFASTSALPPLTAEETEETETQTTDRQEQAAEEDKESRERGSASDVEEHKQLLQRHHDEEIKRLEATKAVAEERDRDDMINEADEMIEAARKRHAAALQQLERLEPEEGEND